MADDTVSEIRQRLIDVESRLAYHERVAEELSDVIAAQDKTINTLIAHVRNLLNRLDDREADWAPSPQDSKPPPHY